MRTWFNGGDKLQKTFERCVGAGFGLICIAACGLGSEDVGSCCLKLFWLGIEGFGFEGAGMWVKL